MQIPFYPISLLICCLKQVLEILKNLEDKKGYPYCTVYSVRYEVFDLNHFRLDTSSPEMKQSNEYEMFPSQEYKK